MDLIYEALLQREADAIPRLVSDYLRTHTEAELLVHVARFAVLAFAPTQHGRGALLACTATADLRPHLGGDFVPFIIECAIYAGRSRQPWSEPPIADVPAVEDSTSEDLLKAIESSDRPAAERWLASNMSRQDFARDLMRASLLDFSECGQAAITAAATLRLAPLLGDRGRYVVLRAAILDVLTQKHLNDTPDAGPAAGLLAPRLVAHALASNGSIDSSRLVLLFDALIEGASLNGDDGIISRGAAFIDTVIDSASAKPILEAEPPLHAYELARDFATHLQICAATRRLNRRFPSARFEQVRIMSWSNLQNGPWFEEWA